MSALGPIRNAGALLLTLALAGCQASPGIKEGINTASTGLTVTQLLAAASGATGLTQARFLLDAANALIKEDKSDKAAEVLGRVDEKSLDAATRARYIEMQARLELERGNPEAALNLLQDPLLLKSAAQFPQSQQASIGLLRAKILATTGDHFAAAQERIFLDPILKGPQKEQNRKAIWRSLMYIDIPTLRRYRDSAVTDELRGWLDLALISKTTQGNLKAQAEQLDQWSRDWAGHPTARALPGDLAIVRELAAEQPKQVALLLPLSGKLASAGNAVRDGFMAAYYDASAREARLPVVRLYDTEAGTPLPQLCRQAVADGAAVIIGPLEKSQVAQLYQEPPSVPTLALNRADIDDAVPPAQLFQFSLAPEDEAAQVADIAWQQGHRRVLVIAAQSEWQSKEMQAFSRRWQALGGEVATAALFTDQQSLSPVIKNALNIPRSEARAKEIERLLGRSIEFTPRRRKDVDFVFMLARAQEARIIKPMLAYHYGGDLPVYALSRIYGGFPSPDLDRDLEQVRFTEMPWILDNQQPLKQQILTNLPQSRGLLRLYAMGADSFYLYPRLRQLNQLMDSRIPGQTGFLSIDSRQIVRRELKLAEMRNGRPAELPISLRTDEREFFREDNGVGPPLP
jgi:outer membrane PBP1 activator LpoA protein